MECGHLHVVAIFGVISGGTLAATHLNIPEMNLHPPVGMVSMAHGEGRVLLALTRFRLLWVLVSHRQVKMRINTVGARRSSLRKTEPHEANKPQ